MYKLVILMVLVSLFCGFRYLIVPYSVKKNINFNEIKEKSLPLTPNYYLLCPEDQCQPDTKHGVSPIYLMTVPELKQEWDNMIARQPRTELLATKDNGNQRLYVQYSAFWHFPDFIHIKFVPLDKDESTYYLLSHSLFGHYDFGVNRKRLIQWQQDI